MISATSVTSAVDSASAARSAVRTIARPSASATGTLFGVFALVATAIVMPLGGNAAMAGGTIECTSGWQPGIGQPGPTRVVSAIRRHDGLVYAGTAEFSVQSIFRYIDGQWQSGSVIGEVFALGEFESDLIVTGEFKVYFETEAGPGTGVAYNVARFDGTSWSDLDDGNDGPDGPVYASIVHDGDLIIGGNFFGVGPISTRGIARFDGTAWQPVGGDLGAVVALAVLDGELVAGGSISPKGIGGGYNVLRFDGTSWSKVGSGFNGQVLALAVYDGQLIVGGAFTSAGGVAAHSIARFNGTRWEALPTASGSGVAGAVTSLTIYGGDLVAAVNSTNAHDRLVRYDGAEWSSVGQGADGPIRDLHADDETLFIGGAFQIVGTAAPSRHVAAWVECPTPSIPGDLNGDGVVNAQDLAILLSFWGSCADCGDCIADLNGDCVVNAQDLAELLSYWG